MRGRRGGQGLIGAGMAAGWMGVGSIERWGMTWGVGGAGGRMRVRGGRCASRGRARIVWMIGSARGGRVSGGGVARRGRRGVGAGRGVAWICSAWRRGAKRVCGGARGVRARAKVKAGTRAGAGRIWSASGGGARCVRSAAWAVLVMAERAGRGSSVWARARARARRGGAKRWWRQRARRWGARSRDGGVSRSPRRRAGDVIWAPVLSMTARAVACGSRARAAAMGSVRRGRDAFTCGRGSRRGAWRRRRAW